jgi:hypothetical protein
MRAFFPQFQARFRTGDFVTGARARLWAGALIAGLAAGLAFLLATAHGVADYAGRPLGTDFSNVYAAGRFALEGQATAPFDIVRQGAMERAVFGPDTQLYGWHYPPVFLLIAAPLAVLSYGAALALWLAATLALYLFAVRLLLKAHAPTLARGASWWLLALGFPAVLVNLLHGQNGFLTAALMALGLALLAPRPILSGIAFGLLCYKPQYFAVIPLVLCAAGHWRTLAAAAVTVAVAAVLATLVFGWAVWPAFLQGAHFTRTVVLEQGNTGFPKMQSVFAAVRLWGGGIGLAYAAQAAAALAALGIAWRVWRQDQQAEIKGAVLCVAALLVTPYSLDYDLMLLAPAIALMAAHGARDGFADWELSATAMLWLLPGLARMLAQHAMIPLAVPLLLIFLALMARRLPRARFHVLKSASW